ncbi:putative elongation factor 1-beta protein [Phaeoacremonium minimum UCRPA7]|uniref:Putative elongation factor 1-beta protein n=1 Tax=Phaeoacremonium minimum (strain UCR-PA7) TaxID=1286976 RepID=R8BIW8_PHAM7|nr:putative elongation factor 1-beta protein [Phaeoacremonium minimum UCRPA7]EON99268.1 putative elongation factor 1-beta protein [Phaeoacremonium minimum UCRPA7]
MTTSVIWKKRQGKKEAKPNVAVKSLMIRDVMPRDNETDMNAPEESVGAIKIYDLVWSASEFVAVGFGNKKIRINFVNEN